MKILTVYFIKNPEAGLTRAQWHPKGPSLLLFCLSAYFSESSLKGGRWSITSSYKKHPKQETKQEVATGLFSIPFSQCKKEKAFLDNPATPFSPHELARSQHPHLPEKPGQSAGGDRKYGCLDWPGRALLRLWSQEKLVYMWVMSVDIFHIRNENW